MGGETAGDPAAVAALAASLKMSPVWRIYSYREA